MKKFKLKFVAVLLMAIFILSLVPANVFASNENLQIAKTDNGYIVYIKDKTDSFRYAISEKSDLPSGSTELNYINSVEDGNGNKVALIENATYESIKDKTNYFYVEGETTPTKLDFSDAIKVADVEKVETTTNRIKTELKTNIEQRNEVVDGVKYTETVGGIEIASDDENRDTSTYSYVRSNKLPDGKYSELQELANELDQEGGDYESKSMYEKIEYAKKFNKLYDELIAAADWKPVENYLIKQPIEAQKGDKYVVLLKKVAEDGTTTYDAKFLTSYREDEEEKIPASTKKVPVKETAKLPITGESLVIYGILAIIAIALIVVFVRMKKLKKQGKE